MLSDDYFDPAKVPDEAIKKLKSVLTVVDGKVVYDRDEAGEMTRVVTPHVVQALRPAGLRLTLPAYDNGVPMNCPACGHSLQPVQINGMSVNACRSGCAGAWFDQADVKRIAHPTDEEAEYFRNIERDPGVIVDFARRRRCPRCPDSVLMRHYSSARRAVVVDECPTCAGIWLDAGELEAIRAERSSARPPHQATGDNVDAAVSSLLSSSSRSAAETRISWSRAMSSLLTGLYLVLTLKRGARAQPSR